MDENKMPLDPTLDELSQQQQSPPQGPPSPADAASMTHWPEQPNPAAPYLDAAKRFGTGGGLSGIFPQLQSPTLSHLAHGLQEAASYSMPMLGTLRMARAPAKDFFSNFGGKDSFKLVSKETGNEMGQLHSTFDPKSKDLKIDYMGSLISTPKGFGGDQWKQHWGIGTHEMQTLGPEILREYPDVQTVSFLRLPGIRDPGTGARAGRQSRMMKFAVVRTPDGGMTLELIESRKVGELPRLSSPMQPRPGGRASPVDPITPMSSPPRSQTWIDREFGGQLPPMQNPDPTISITSSRTHPNAQPGSLDELINSILLPYQRN